MGAHHRPVRFLGHDRLLERRPAWKRGRKPVCQATAPRNPRRGPIGEQRSWCLNKLTGLKDELDAELTHELARTSTPKARTTRERWERWSANWESELNDASARCSTGIDPDMAAGYQKLRELYDGYCAGLLRIVRSRTELMAELNSRIDHLKPKLWPSP